MMLRPAPEDRSCVCLREDGSNCRGRQRHLARLRWPTGDLECFEWQFVSRRSEWRVPPEPTACTGVLAIRSPSIHTGPQSARWTAWMRSAERFTTES